MADGALPPFKLLSKAGVKLDGTQLEGDYYTDALWCRFDRERPRKMGGYRVSNPLMHGPSRGLFIAAQDSDISTVHNGWSDGIEVIQVQETGLALGPPPIDRTPSGFVASPENLWIADTLYNVGDTNTAIIAVAVPAATTIASTTQATIYFGDLNDTAALDALSPTDGPSTTAGGLFCMSPYLVVYDVAGYVTWSAPNEPDNFATADGGGGVAGARIAATKVVCGIPLRGGPGNSPAALLWTLNTLVRMSFVGGTPVFSFDTISTDITVMSQKAIVESDGVYIWAGTDRFYIFNGVVRELPCELLKNWFFDNMNYSCHEKTFAFRNPRWGEIWFCFPYGNATECTHAAVYNYRYGTWYPTLLPNGGRSAGAFQQILRYPMLMGSTEITSGGGLYRLWQHEFGVDEVLTDLGVTNAVQSYFETADIALPTGTFGQAANLWLSPEKLEPDFVLSGALSVTLRARKYAMSPEPDLKTVTFDPAQFDPAHPQTYTVPFKKMGRINRIRIESNVVGGDYQLGDTLCIATPEQSRQ